MFSHGVWGRVIDYPYYWSKKEADVVCRQLGFPDAITAVRYSAFGEGSRPVLMSGVRCLGTEKTLQQCSYQNWINSNLRPGYEVGVICKTFNSQPGNNGKKFFIKTGLILCYLVIDHFDRLYYVPLKFKFPAPCEFLKAQRLIAVNDNNDNKNRACSVFKSTLTHLPN